MRIDQLPAKARTLRILHFISNSCDHPYLNRLVENTDLDAFEVFVGSLETRGALHDHFESVGIQTFSLNADRRVGYPKAVLFLVRWLRREKIDIIQTHLFDASVVGLLGSFLARTPVRVMTGHHSHEVQFYKGKPTFWLDVAASRFLSTAIIAPSLNMKELFVDIEGVAANKITVIRHGFSSMEFERKATSSAFEEFGFSNRIKLIAVGKLFWIKGYEGLLRAFREALNVEPKLSLVIVGSGDTALLEELLDEMDLREAVRFAGWRSDVDELLSTADIFVHNSLAESFGMVVIEAMQSGKPIICTNVGIAKELIKDKINGFLVNTNSVPELANAILRMTELRSEWRAIGERNQRLASEFTATEMARNHARLYDELLAKI